MDVEVAAGVNDLERGKRSDCVADFDAHSLGVERWSEWCTRAIHAWKTVLPNQAGKMDGRKLLESEQMDCSWGGMAPMPSMDPIASMAAMECPDW